MQKTLLQIHEDVPSLYYDLGIKHNIFQNLWHNNRFRQVKKISPQVTGKVLDIGCHSGLFTQKIIDSIPHKNVYGVDISTEAIEYAKKRIKGGNFYTANAHTLPFKNNFFDQVYCLEMLEHVEHPEGVVSEIKRVLKKSGNGVILVPTESYLFRLVWFFWNIINPVWKHAHIQHFSEKTLTALLKKYNLKIVESKKFQFNMLLLVQFTKTK